MISATMAVIQNAFANTSSSLLIGKIQGNIVDVLMPPLSASELTLGFVGGGVTRGIVVGVAVTLGMWLFVPIRIHDPLAIAWFGINAAVMLSLLGMIGGIWADKFDQLAAVTNFVIMPLTFLSGTFYAVSRLPEPFRTMSDFNPVYYLIDGFRYGFTGHAESNLAIGVALTLALMIILAAVSYLLLRAGYKLKS